MSTFGERLKTLRKQTINKQTGKRLTQAQVADQLEIITGFYISPVTISNWERDIHPIDKEDRPSLVGLLQILAEHNGVQSIKEANELLTIGYYSQLTPSEVEQIDPQWLNINSNAPFPSKAGQLSRLPTVNQTVWEIDAGVHKLVEALTTSNQARVVVIGGLKGSGRSTFANQVAERVIRNSEFKQVIWLQLDSRLNHFADLITIIEPHLPQELITHRPSESYTSLRNSVQSVLRNHQLLIVIDGNIQYLETWELLNDIRSLVGPSKFLITADRQPPPFLFGDFYFVQTVELSQSGAVSLMKETMAQNNLLEQVKLDKEALLEIYNQVGGNPELLIWVARSYRSFLALTAGQINTGTLLDRLLQSKWDSLKPHHQAQLVSFVCMGVNGARLTLVRSIHPQPGKQLFETLTHLCNIFLISPHGPPQHERYKMPAVVSHFIVNKLREPDQVKETQQAVTHQHLAYWSNRMADGSADISPEEFEHIAQTFFINFVLGIPITDENLLIDFARMLQRLGAEAGRLGTWHGSLLRCTAYPSENSHSKLQALLYQQLGDSYYASQAFNLAIEYYQKSIELFADSDDAFVNQSRLNLGHAHFRKNNLPLAATQYEAVLEIAKREENGELIADCINGLGRIALYEGKTLSAESSFKEAIKLFKECDEPQKVIFSLVNLGKTYLYDDHWKDALQTYQEALTLAKHHQFRSSQWLATLSLGSLYENMGELNKAKEAWNSLQFEEPITADAAFYLALQQHYLGVVEFQLKNFTQAKKSFQASLKFWRQTDNASRLAHSLISLGKILIAEQNKKEAEQALLEAQSILSDTPNELINKKFLEQIKQLFSDIAES